MDNLTDEEAVWFSALATYRLNEIYESLRDALKDDPFSKGNLRCFAVAQSAAVDAGGFLEYHEGQACDKITGKSQPHAWNTFRGEIIDLMWPPSMYRDYEPEKSYSFAEVKTTVSERNGTWDWLGKLEKSLLSR